MTGHAPGLIRGEHADFDAWFAAHSPSDLLFRTTDLTEGQKLPAPDSSEGWIITGSPLSVYDDIHWLADVQAGIAAAVQAGQPILGVCFGHQLLAQALGGQVTKNPAGWELGEIDVSLTEAGKSDQMMAGCPGNFSAYSSHGDAVVALPPMATLLAKNSKGVQSFKVGVSAYGVQFHPEFSVDIARAYTTYRRDQVSDEISWPRDEGNDSSRLLRNFMSHFVTGENDD